jgi:hypothetical protein
LDLPSPFSKRLKSKAKLNASGQTQSKTALREKTAKPKQNPLRQFTSSVYDWESKSNAIVSLLIFDVKKKKQEKCKIIHINAWGKLSSAARARRPSSDAK